MSFTCEDCPKTFPTTRALASHSKAHRNDVTCPVCNQKVRYLATHVKREHADDPLVRLETGLAEVIGEVRSLRQEVADLRSTKITEAG